MKSAFPISLLLVFVALLLTASSAFPQPRSSCIKQLEPALHGYKPHPIQRTPEKVVPQGAVMETAVLHSSIIPLSAPSLKAPTLDDGIYIYLLTDKTGITLLPRSLIDANGKPLSTTGHILGTHEGIYQLLSEWTPSPEVLGAGEIAVRYGKIRTLSNGSGTFRGDSTHLEYAHRKFRDLKVPFNRNLRLMDFSKSASDPHVTALNQAIADARALKEPEIQQLIVRTRNALSKVKDRNKLGEYFIEKGFTSKDKVERELYNYALQLLVLWDAPLESDATILLNVLNRINREKYEGLLNLLDRDLKRF